MYTIEKSFSIEYFFMSQIPLLSRKLFFFQWTETASLGSAATNGPTVLAPGDK
jgi:hypothetical protein